MSSLTPMFVYGSLKKGFHNYPVLKDSEYIGSFETEDKYEMFGFGSFPAVIKDSHKQHVAGELYSVNREVLQDLDMLEGNGYLYKRELTRLKGYSGSVWMYFYIDDDMSDADKHGVVVRGDTVSWK